MLRRLVLVGAVALPASARAHGSHPRTPVVWDEAACLTVVDRTVDPVLGLHYTIPYEDTTISPGEVADSRRHQFLALCRDYPNTLVALPGWITGDDVAAAAAVGLVDPAKIPASEVLTTSTEWQGCWTRITADDERRPISFEAAMQPVLWDTSSLPVGPRIVLGYTWEPVFNAWWRRTGVVQIVDDLDPAASPPALAVSTPGVLTTVGEPVTIDGCARAMPGSTLTGAYWQFDADAPEWVAFAHDVPLVGEDFSLPFGLPPAVIGHDVAVRVEVVDPLGRRFTGHMTRTALILQGETPPDLTTGDETTGTPTTGGAFDPTTGVATTLTTSGDDTSDTGSGEAGQELDPRGCACDAPAGPPVWSSLALLLLLPRRRAPP